MKNMKILLFCLALSPALFSNHCANVKGIFGERPRPILDAFVVNSASPPEASPSRIYINDGEGRFTASAIIALPDRDSRGVALGDMDRDGDLDAFVVNEGQANRIYTNDGAGNFTVADADSSDTNDSRGVVLGDL